MYMYSKKIKILLNFLSNFLENHSQIALAATLSVDKKKVFVVFGNETYVSNTKLIGLCEFDFTKIQNAFDKTWEDCQKIEDAKKQKKVCF